MNLSIILCLLLAPLNNGFLPTSKTLRNRPRLFVASDEYTGAEVEEMRELVLSISLEPTDLDRRERLKDVFEEALARPNGAPKRFSDLFDMTLVKLGDEIQMEAKKKYLEKQAAKEEEGTTEEDEEGVVVNSNSEDGETPKPKGLEFKSQEEFQLWALVDMMVQSKTIVKKENGDLGSKGTFQ